MEDFIVKHSASILGSLSCFDRVVFKGYLPICDPGSMEGFLCRKGVQFKDFKRFGTDASKRVREFASALAQREGRPFLALEGRERKEDKARSIAQADGITKGLICVFTAQESTQSFRLRYGKGLPRLTKCRPHCQCVYFYFMDRDFGMMHVRISTWFPFSLQICVNGHEWLARKLERADIAYEKVDNVFVSIADCKRAQRFANRFTGQNFPRIFNAIAKRVNPLLKDLLQEMEYYWVTDQAEFATDVMFKDRAALGELYPTLLRHATLCFGAEDVLTFLGRKLTGNFKGEVLTDCKKRWQGARVKHRMKGNWIKMYDKMGRVLRIETVINHPYEFRVRREGIRKGVRVKGWFPMSKGVCNLYRYAEVSLKANESYLQALCAVEIPLVSNRMLNEVCKRGTRNGRTRRGLNPLRQDDLALFKAALNGDHFIHGLRNRDLAEKLGIRLSKNKLEAKRQSARVTRLLQLLHAHGLIAKYPRSRRWRVTTRGKQIMSAVVQIRDHMPHVIHKAA